MKSSSHSIEAPQRKAEPWSVRKRIFLVALVYAIELIYIPTSNRVAGGFEPKLPIDVFPVWSIWVLPYVLCYALWFWGFLWAALKMDQHLLRAFLVSSMVTFGIGVGTFIFFPTYIKAMPVPGRDIFSLLLRFIHENWGRYDAFPSGHIYITTLIALFYSRWYPRTRALWVVTMIVVAFSTLFTGQHYIADVIGGFVLALAGYHFGLWWAGFYPVQKQRDKRSERRIPSSSLD